MLPGLFRPMNPPPQGFTESLAPLITLETTLPFPAADHESRVGTSQSKALPHCPLGVGLCLCSQAAAPRGPGAGHVPDACLHPGVGGTLFQEQGKVGTQDIYCESTSLCVSVQTGGSAAGTLTAAEPPAPPRAPGDLSGLQEPLRDSGRLLPSTTYQEGQGGAVTRDVWRGEV